MASIITTIYESAWTPVRDQIIALPSRDIPSLDAYLPIHLYTLLVALNNAYFLRVALQVPAHWARVLLTLAILVVGGGSSVALLHGNALPVLGQSNVIVAIILAFYIIFWSPNNIGTKLYTNPNIRLLWQFVGALQIGTAVTAGLETGKTNGHLVQVLLAIISTVGGAMIAESTNLLLLAQDAYIYPRGPSVNFLCALHGALFHLVLTGSIQIPYLGSYVKVDNSQDATALLIVLLTVINHLYTPSTLQDLSAKVMSNVPGVSSVITPMDVNVSDETMPWPLDQGLWGYEIVSPAEYLLNASQYDRVFTTEEEIDDSSVASVSVPPKSAKKETPAPAPVEEEKKSSGRSRAASKARK